MARPRRRRCAAMTRVADDGRLVARDACDGPIVTERVVVTRAPEDARMFFHWWRFFKALVGEVYAFWVNQDVVVPPAAFLGAVRGAAASPLNRRLLAG